MILEKAWARLTQIHFAGKTSKLRLNVSASSRLLVLPRAHVAGMFPPHETHQRMTIHNFFRHSEVGAWLIDGRWQLLALSCGIRHVVNESQLECFQRVQAYIRRQWSVAECPQYVGVDHTDVGDAPENVLPPPSP